ncbi:MFS transporter [Streptomyces sp. LS1784]|uniref:MFS transporter n=1 Tax=Streptomyces sp. LS1784 TaxID=2851533 RepID=UPI001CC987FA|nr:MFS transporter [Streptomyces sp. LS1784]
MENVTRSSIPGIHLLKDKNFARLFAARFISTLGNGFGPVALSFGVLGLKGGSPWDLSLVLACQTLSMLLFSLFGGVLSDLFPRSRVMVVAQVIEGLAYAALALLILAESPAIWALCLCAALSGVCTATFSPAYVGVVKEVVDDVDLQEANGLMKVGINVAKILGLSLGGPVVLLAGAATSLAVDSLSFVISGVLIYFTRISPVRAMSRQSLFQEIRLGASGFFSRSWLWVLSIQYAVAFACMNATAGVLGPLLAKTDLGGAASWSVITSAQAVGAVGGAVIALRVRTRRPILVAACVTCMMAAVPFALGFGAPLLLIAFTALAAGVAADIFEVLFFATLQRDVPAEMISRVGSWDMLGSLSLAPLGVMLAGPAAAEFGVHTALIGFGSVVVVATGCVLLVPAVRVGRLLDEPVVEQESAQHA